MKSMVVSLVTLSLCFHINKGDAEVKLPPELKELLDSFHGVCVDSTGVSQSKKNHTYLELLLIHFFTQKVVE